jgi:hypothetical protein
MSTTSSQLLGCMIRLVKRELDAWKALSAPGAAAEDGGSADSTNPQRVAEAQAALHAELQKLSDGALIREIQERQVVTALLAGVKVLFKGLCDPKILSAVSLPVLAGSATLEALHSLQKALPVSAGSLMAVPSEAIDAALPGLQRGVDNESASNMAALLQYFVDETCEKGWGIDDVWGEKGWVTDVDVVSRPASPLCMVAGAGNVVLAGIILQKAKKANVVEAIYNAYCAGHADVFDLLIDDDRCLATVATDQPLFIRFLDGLREAISEDRKAQSRLMTERFLRRWPQSIRSSWKVGKHWRGPLEMAVTAREVELVKLMLALTPDSLSFDSGVEAAEGGEQNKSPTLKSALWHPCAGILRVLANYGAFAAPNYHPSVLPDLGQTRALFLSCGFPLKPKYEEQYKAITAHRKDIREVMDVVLAARFPSFATGYNIAVGSVFTSEECIMEEEHAISSLRKCKEYGLDIIHIREEEVGKPHALSLVHLAARAGYHKLLDWAIDLQGPASVDAWYAERHAASGPAAKHTPLTEALHAKRIDTGLRLLRHHKAKAVYRGDVPDGINQPLLCALELRDDAAALPVVMELMKQDPTLCDLDCYRQCSLRALNPIVHCCVDNMPRCLEALLSADLPGAGELCTLEQTLIGESEGSPLGVVVTAATAAALRNSWDVLAVLLRYYPGISVISGGEARRSNETLVGNLPSVEELVKRSRAPRSIIVRVEALAQKQREETQKRKVIAANSVIPSNAFEEPGPKVLTEAEEKRKAKKRAAKKRAKEKKRASAKEAQAGAGKDGDDRSDSDSSSGSDEEEEGMDEEERMLARAPNFDLEKEKAARRARAEAEAKAKEGEK